MQDFWVRIEDSTSQESRNNILKAVSKAGAIIVAEGADLETAKVSGIRTVSSIDGDIILINENDFWNVNQLKSQGKCFCAKISIRNQTDEEKVSKVIDLGFNYVLVSCPDWKIIPLENIIAKTRGRVKILAEVFSPNEARLALETLEIGVDGITLVTSNPKDVETTKKILVDTRKYEKKLVLVPAKLIAVKQLGLGHRVCIDTCDIMTQGEGLLIGSQSSGLFLIQAEVQENPHIEPRPFRVNAGPISLYVLTPGNKTRYLSELKTGDEVEVVDREGRIRSVIVGRVKIERRPLTLIETEIKGCRLKTIVQNAETIRFVTKNGSKSVTDLKEGDELLVYYQPGGRHFGTLVSEETVIEI